MKKGTQSRQEKAPDESKRVSFGDNTWIKKIRSRTNSNSATLYASDVPYSVRHSVVGVQEPAKKKGIAPKARTRVVVRRKRRRLKMPRAFFVKMDGRAKLLERVAGIKNPVQMKWPSVFEILTRNDNHKKLMSTVCKELEKVF